MYWGLSWTQPALHLSEHKAASLKPWGFCTLCSGTGSMSKNSPRVCSFYDMFVGHWDASYRGRWVSEKGLWVSFVFTCRPRWEYPKRSRSVLQNYMFCVLENYMFNVLQKSFCSWNSNAKHVPGPESNRIANSSACLSLHGGGSSGPAVGHSIKRCLAPPSLLLGACSAKLFMYEVN